MVRFFGYQMSKRKLGIFLLDAFLFWVCFLTVSTLKYGNAWTLTYPKQFIFPLSLVWVTYLVVFYIGELYELNKDFFSQKEILNIVLVCAAALLASVVVVYPNYLLRLSRGLFVYTGLLMTAATLASRLTLNAYQGRAGYKKRTLIVGTMDFGRTIYEEAQGSPSAGTNVVAFYEPLTNGVAEGFHELPVVQARDAKLADVVRRYDIRQIILAIPLGGYDPVLKECFRLSHEGVEIVRGEDWYELHTGKVPIRFIDDSWLLSAEFNKPKLYVRKVKRLMDLSLATLGLILGAPVMAAVGLAVYLESGRPVFFIQDRAGRGGKPFKMFKFRTMWKNDNPGEEARLTTANDPRITRVGRLIRRFRLDELPQLFNVWRGEMSLIGPRPEVYVFLNDFLKPKPTEIMGRRREDAGRKVILNRSQETLPYYSKRLLLQPGITGWAQVNYNYAESFEESEVRLMYDLYYLKNMSVTLDCLILLRTIRAIFLGRGAR